MASKESRTKEMEELQLAYPKEYQAGYEGDTGPGANWSLQAVKAYEYGAAARRHANDIEAKREDKRRREAESRMVRAERYFAPAGGNANGNR